MSLFKQLEILKNMNMDTKRKRQIVAVLTSAHLSLVPVSVFADSSNEVTTVSNTEDNPSDALLVGNISKVTPKSDTANVVGNNTSDALEIGTVSKLDTLFSKEETQENTQASDALEIGATSKLDTFFDKEEKEETQEEVNSDALDIGIISKVDSILAKEAKQVSDNDYMELGAKGSIKSLFSKKKTNYVATAQITSKKTQRTQSNISVSYERVNSTLDQATESKNKRLNIIGNSGNFASKKQVKDSINPLSYTGSIDDLTVFLNLGEFREVDVKVLNDYLDKIGTNSKGAKTVLKGKGQSFIDAAKKYNIDPIYLFAHSMLESDHGRSNLSRGYYNAILNEDGSPRKAGRLVEFNKGDGKITGTQKVYNFFGIGAYDATPTTGGVTKAFEEKWFTVDKAIEGSAKWIAEKYIHSNEYKGQNTLYSMRWDFAQEWHQYASDIHWAKSISDIMIKLKKAYVNPHLSYVIPVFENEEDEVKVAVNNVTSSTPVAEAPSRKEEDDKKEDDNNSNKGESGKKEPNKEDSLKELDTKEESNSNTEEKKEESENTEEEKKEESTDSTSNDSSNNNTTDNEEVKEDENENISDDLFVASNKDKTGLSGVLTSATNALSNLLGIDDLKAAADELKEIKNTNNSNVEVTKDTQKQEAAKPEPKTGIVEAKSIEEVLELAQ